MIGSSVVVVVAATVLSYAGVNAQCGTSKVNLSCLKAASDYTLPSGIPCTLPQCAGGKLPWTVYINMCQPIQMSGPLVTKCAGALACQQWPGDSASLGQFSSVSYADTNNGVIVTASGGTPDDGIARQMSLTITCGPSPGDPYPTFTNEDSSSLTYSFTWSRPEACGSGCGAGPTPPGPPSPPGPPGPTTQHEGLDVGWWVFIFLFVFIAVYFIGGIIFMAVVKGARGVEMVPNLTFWTDLPALVKDGCLFLVSKVRRDRSSFSSV